MAHVSPSHGLFPVFSTLDRAANINPTTNSWIAFDTSQYKSLTGVCVRILANAYIVIPSWVPPQRIAWATGNESIAKYVRPKHAMGSQLHVIHDIDCKEVLNAACAVPNTLDSNWISEERERQDKASDAWYEFVPEGYVEQHTSAECVRPWNANVWN